MCYFNVCFIWHVLDHWFTKCFYAPTHIRRISGCLSGYGTHGRQSVSGHSNGLGPWTNVIFIVSNVVRDKASPFSWNNPQGRWFFFVCLFISILSACSLIFIDHDFFLNHVNGHRRTWSHPILLWNQIALWRYWTLVWHVQLARHLWWHRMW